MSTAKTIAIAAGATLAGLVVGGVINMSIIIGGSAVVPPPAGVNVQDPASINAHIGEYSALAFTVPWLAHAVGTLAGAIVACLIAPSRRSRVVAACIIGVMFLIGGISAVMMIPDAPLWFDTADLALAYLPMAWLGLRIAARLRPGA